MAGESQQSPAVAVVTYAATAVVGFMVEYTVIGYFHNPGLIKSLVYTVFMFIDIFNN